MSNQTLTDKFDGVSKLQFISNRIQTMVKMNVTMVNATMVKINVTMVKINFIQIFDKNKN